MNKACDKFAQIVGSEFVVRDPIQIRAAERTTYPTEQTIRGIVRPANTAEVQACLEMAQQEGIALYPTSTGKNWGYGSRVPITDGCTLLDLRRLNQIRDFNEELGYVTVETGVTFAQLFRFLREQKSNLLLSVTSSTPESSVVANALERGIGSGANADRLLAGCGLEVVLPHGKMIRTGFSRFDNSAVGPLHRHGVGPSLDGLFAQSNLGVVTAMTLWLVRRPEHLGILFVTADSDGRLGGLVDAFREAVFDHLVRPPLALFNRERVLSIIETALPAAPDQADTCRPPSVPAWSGDLAIYSSNSWRLRSALTELAERFASHADSLITFEVAAAEIDCRLASGAQPIVGRPAEEDTLKWLLIEKHLGIPRSAPVRQLYWKKRFHPAGEDYDPDRDRCGLLWCCPVVPLRDESIRRAVHIITHTGAEFGVSIPASIQCLTERSATIVASLLYDRDEPGADQSAVACHQVLTGRLAQVGYYSYRENTLALARPHPQSSYTETLSSMKCALDPRNILAPLRYVE